MRWRRGRNTLSARTAARPIRAGPASAKPAANGIRWSRKAPKGRGAPHARAGCSPSSRLKANRKTRRGLPPASPSSIALPAAAWCAVRCCFSAAIPASANRRCCLRSAAAFARGRHRAVYISGEEAVAQVRLRAERLGLSDAPVEVAAETSVEDIVATLSQGATPGFWSSIRSRRCGRRPSKRRPGTVTQVRGSAAELIRFAKRTGAAVILVGHVTKDGQIAGPRVVEHMVDAVLSFEGEGSQQFRILRAIKNRFGPTDEIGVFEMTGAGLPRSRKSVRAVPVRARSRQPRHRCLCRNRGDPAAPGRNPGAGRSDVARDPAARGRRLGSEPAVDGAGGARGPLRRPAVGP